MQAAVTKLCILSKEAVLINLFEGKRFCSLMSCRKYYLFLSSYHASTHHFSPQDCRQHLPRHHQSSRLNHQRRLTAAQHYPEHVNIFLCILKYFSDLNTLVVESESLGPGAALLLHHVLQSAASISKPVGDLGEEKVRDCSTIHDTTKVLYFLGQKIKIG